MPSAVISAGSGSQLGAGRMRAAWLPSPAAHAPGHCLYQALPQHYLPQDLSDKGLLPAKASAAAVVQEPTPGQRRMPHGARDGPVLPQQEAQGMLPERQKCLGQQLWRRRRRQGQWNHLASASLAGKAMVCLNLNC